MVKALATIFIYLSPVVAFAPVTIAIDPSNAIIKQIIANKPDISPAYAKRIATSINNLSKKHKIPANIFAAILMQESRYTLNSVNKKSRDFGISQINWRTIKSYKFDKKKLMGNLEYSLEAGAIVLKDFMVRFKHEQKWWTRYNGSKSENRKRYLAQVERFF